MFIDALLIDASDVNQFVGGGIEIPEIHFQHHNNQQLQ
jgi:hypothetical protein